jgi:probable HAF family extracellular repeat protein
LNNPQKIPRRLTDTFHILSFACLLGSLITTPAFGLQYQSIIDLGVDVRPADINNNGTVTGSCKTGAPACPDGAAASVAFRYTLSGGIELLNKVAVAANAINDSEQITGNTATGAFLYDGNLRQWDGYTGSGINEHGQISGNKALKNPYRATPLPRDPAIYTPNSWDNMGIAQTYSRGTRKGVYADLYSLRDINNLGYAVGSRSRYGLAGSSAILTTPAFDTVIYLSIPYGGYASALNDQLMIACTSGTNTSAGAYAHALLYDYNSVSYTDLGTLTNASGENGLTSSAADINEQNQVVGSSWLVSTLTSVYDPSTYHAFVWDEVSGMQDLNALLPDSATSGWVLTAATAINYNGDIVGTALDVDGKMHGFLLTNADAQATPPPVVEASAPTKGKRGKKK